MHRVVSGSSEGSLGAFYVDVKRVNPRRVVDVEKAAGADLADAGVVERDSLGDDVVGGPCLPPSRLNMRHEAGRP